MIYGTPEGTPEDTPASALSGDKITKIKRLWDIAIGFLLLKKGKIWKRVYRVWYFIVTKSVKVTSYAYQPQTKVWVGHCACVVETGLATEHWSGKSEGCV